MFNTRRLRASVAAAGVAAATAAGLLLSGGMASAATPTVVALPYGHMALGVLGQSTGYNTPVIAWEDDEYQGVAGRTDPGEQFNLLPVKYTAADGTVLTVANAYQLQFAPGGDATANVCVSAITVVKKQRFALRPCAVSSAAAVAPGTSGTAGAPGTVTGNQWQDFYYKTGTTDLGSGYGMLEPMTGSFAYTAANPTATPAASPASVTYTPASKVFAANDAGYGGNGAHIINWPAISSLNEEFTGVSG